MSVREAWIDLLHRAATGTRATRTLLTPIGVVVFGAFTALFVAAAVCLDSLAGLPSLLPRVARLPLSVPVMALGLGLTFWSAAHFLRVKGTPVPFNPPPVLVTTGPYRWSRNPMLTGVFLILLGLGLAIGSFALVLVFLPLFILVNVWELRQIEEPELAQRLGEAYLEYRSRTPMFVPGLGTWIGRRERRGGTTPPDRNGGVPS